MKLVALFALNYIGLFLIYHIDAYNTNRVVTFPLVYKWTKRTKEDSKKKIFDKDFKIYF